METAMFETQLSKNGITVQKDEPMHLHTTFRIGGTADLFVKINNNSQLAVVLKAARDFSVPYFILGRGSDLLVSDLGIEGAVISLSGMDQITVSGNNITCLAGAALCAVCTAAATAGLSGLEFAYGIPGSAGGGLYMNAGAYGGEMSQVVTSAEAYDQYGKPHIFSLEDMNLGYRKSKFRENGFIITKITFALKPDNSDAIRARMNDYMERRKQKQPLEYPSAGSTFKRPNGYFAGALIEKNGLKGEQIGGAQISEKHAGFLINKNNATCADVLALMDLVSQKVLKNDGVLLEPEVIFVGRKQAK